MLEILAGKIAGSVLGASVGAAAKGFMPGPGAGVAVAPTFPRLRLKKPVLVQSEDVDRLAKHVAGRLNEFVKRESSPLPENEKQAALILATESFENSSVDLWECDLNPELYSRRVLRETSTARAQAGLSQAAAEYCEILVQEISLQLVQFVTSWPTFAARVELEQLDRLRLLIDAVVAIRAKMGPDLRVEDLDFESRYASLVVSALNRLQIFGLDLADRANRSYDLSAAYITLSVAPVTKRGTPVLSTPRHSAQEYGETEDDDLKDAVQRIANADSGVGMQAETAVSAYKRILLRGDAGSGKTTLLQWLAVNASNRSFLADLANWNSLVPFMLPLRRYAKSDLPNPSQFFPVVGSLLSDEMPEKWVHRLLRSGRALILIDGVDELPSEQRDMAREWLRSLVTTYPDATYIVTSRPAAAEVDWLSDDGFAVLDMLPMNQRDVEKFVAHWHSAAKKGETDAVEVATLNQGESDLVQSIREERQLRRIASNPLLCALLCTLNRDRHSQLPRDRMELYRAALDLLLLRRDRERKINYPEPPLLGDSQKKSILGSFAHWLIRNGLTDASQEQAIKQVSLALQSMPAVTSEASSVYEYLLVRSGCLRKPVPDRVDFIHRTFQEYLAAARIVEIDDFENLLSNAHLDQWHEVFVMAVGHSRPKERSVLLSGLIERGEREPENRKRLHLLAAACLETATECDPPNVYSRIRDITADLIPPRRITDAKELALAGEMVIPLIPDRRLSAAEAAATIRMAAIVGGDGALSLVSRYARDKRVTVQREIRQSWEYFDSEEYADRVLSQSPETWRKVDIYLPHMLWALRHLSELEDLDVVCPVQGVAWISELSRLKSLIFRNPVEDLSFEVVRRACTQLSHLSFMTGKAIDSFENLSGLQSLENLNIYRIRESAFSLSPFPSLPNLTRLSLHGGVSELDCADLAVKLPSVRNLWLSLDQAVIGIRGLDSMRELRQLNLHAVGGIDVSPLAEAPQLKSLNLRVEAPVDVSPLAISTSLTRLTLSPRFRELENHFEEFDLRPFIGSGRAWKISVSSLFGCVFVGADHPAVTVAEPEREARPTWQFFINGQPRK
ncbi:NACHT domain-containing protein [Streptomyces sp. NPDC059209]|uniref:NACHT domain-containing protein n=1 Tax=Streptomyces sp. NPDC059209 TaxID=3346769 RepID=UPI00367E629C